MFRDLDHNDDKMISPRSAKFSVYLLRDFFTPTSDQQIFWLYIRNT